MKTEYIALYKLSFFGLKSIILNFKNDEYVCIRLKNENPLEYKRWFTNKGKLILTVKTTVNKINNSITKELEDIVNKSYYMGYEDFEKDDLFLSLKPKFSLNIESTFDKLKQDGHEEIMTALLFDN